MRLYEVNASSYIIVHNTHTNTHTYIFKNDYMYIRKGIDFDYYCRCFMLSSLLRDILVKATCCYTLLDCFDVDN